ncbi:10210_t:CDS:2 [Acaulospora colombiana]|uniref:10210_t:CDS:1 n=1 Tax=Acaulospora colombiana TaxID=27376 RepID=A0ACA9KLZ0_9GLOM|nr:10210_t:CDS:2 [Acaulospora colombiana]
MEDCTLTYSIDRSGSLPPVSLGNKRANEIRVDLKRIEIFPTGASLDIRTDKRLALILEYVRQDIQLCLNEMKDKVIIPLDEVIGFRVTEYKEMEILFRDNFERSYYYDGAKTKGDPTNGLLENAKSLIFTPINYVTLNNLIAVEAGIAKYRVEKQTRVLKNNNPQSDLSDEIYITCVLFVERGSMVVPSNITLKTLLELISRRFRLQLNDERVTYKNGAGDIITLKDEEDWRVAKWEAKYEKKIGVEVHLT